METIWCLKKRGMGEIDDVRYEAVRLKLAYNTTYLPDFMVVKHGFPIEFHETKGRKFEAGMAKLKIAATRFPWFLFYMVEKKNKQWVITPIKISD